MLVYAIGIRPQTAPRYGSYGRTAKASMLQDVEFMCEHTLRILKNTASSKELRRAASSELFARNMKGFGFKYTPVNVQPERDDVEEKDYDLQCEDDFVPFAAQEAMEEDD
jgi:hypothetical protein